jgi:ferric-dicitrate binding protein FerR (iron transport regulator)
MIQFGRFATSGHPGDEPIAAPAYRPGVCNIGPEEIARRRRSGHVGALLTLGLLVLLVAADAPPVTRLALVIPATISASGYLQAWLKFCAGFGAMGVRNFGPLGRTEPVEDEAARAADRRRAREIGLVSLGVGLAVALVAVVLPI